MLDAGYPLSDVTAALCERWGLGVTVLPMTDERCETHVVVDLDGARRAIHFQEWWVRHRAALRQRAVCVRMPVILFVRASRKWSLSGAALNRRNLLLGNRNGLCQVKSSFRACHLGISRRSQQEGWLCQR